MFMVCELCPAGNDRHKSFYGKAKVLKLDNGNAPCKQLLAVGRHCRRW